MHVIECTSLDPNRLVVEILAKVSVGTSATLRGEGRYVSTVSLAVAVLCSEHLHAVKVSSWTAVPSDIGAVHQGLTPSLSVSFVPATAPAAAPTPAPAAASVHMPSALPSPHSFLPPPSGLPSPVLAARAVLAESPVFTSRG